jgi:hypothetical protein
MNKQIVRAAWMVYKTPPSVFEKEPGWCLAFVRHILQSAFPSTPKDPRAWLEKYAFARVETPLPNRTWWARDFERTVSQVGLAVDKKDLQPGDLVFKWDTAKLKLSKPLDVLYQGMPDAQHIYVGHVGILVAEGVVMENINPDFRKDGKAFGNKGCISLSDFNLWPAVTKCARFNPERYL